MKNASREKEMSRAEFHQLLDRIRKLFNACNDTIQKLITRIEERDRIISEILVDGQLDKSDVEVK